MNRIVRNIKFDMTVNLGHILAVMGFFFSAVGIWYTLDKRVVVLESSSVHNAVIHQRIEKDIDEVKRLTREDLRLINTKIDKLLERQR